MVDRAVALSPTRYLNDRLLHYSGRFEYLSFAHFIIEHKKISDSIIIALTKVHGQSLTASNLKFTKSCVSRPGLFVSHGDTKYSLLPKAYV